MGLNCYLLILNENGIREIALDRDYVFDGIIDDKWQLPSELKQQIHAIVNTNKESANGYKTYWQAYAIACLEQLTDNIKDKVVIVCEQHSIITQLFMTRETLKLHNKFTDKQLLKLKNYNL